MGSPTTEQNTESNIHTPGESNKKYVAMAKGHIRLVQKGVAGAWADRNEWVG